MFFLFIGLIKTTLHNHQVNYILAICERGIYNSGAIILQDTQVLDASLPLQTTTFRHLEFFIRILIFLIARRTVDDKISNGFEMLF